MWMAGTRPTMPVMAKTPSAMQGISSYASSGVAGFRAACFADHDDETAVPR
jgi:hypothetical protein